MAKLHFTKLEFGDATKLLETLDGAYGLVWSNSFLVHGPSLTASIKKNHRLSKDFTTDRFDVEVFSNVLSESTLEQSLMDFEYFRSMSINENDYSPAYNQ